MNGDYQPLGATEVARHLGVAESTVKKWRHRRIMPPPDWVLGGRPIWDVATIDTWARSTGRKEET